MIVKIEVKFFNCTSKDVRHLSQLSTHTERFLLPYLCGYRTGFSRHFAVISLIEKWRKNLDNKRNTRAVLMDLSKAFHTINHKLLIAKLHAYGLSKDSLKILLSYLSDRWQRTKINLSFNCWSELLQGVSQGSVWTLAFNAAFYRDWLKTRVLC